MESAIVIKVKYGKTLRRFTARVDQAGQLELDMGRLRERVLALFNFSPDADLTLTYTDEDGDVVTLVDEVDLHDVMRQSLNPLRITVKLNTEKGGRFNRSSGNSTPMRSPRVQHPLLNLNSGVSDILRTVPEPFREVLSKLSLDLASKAASSVPEIAELVDCFSKMGQSYINHASEIHDVAKSGTPGDGAGSSMTKEPRASKDDDGAAPEVMPNAKIEEPTCKSNQMVDLEKGTRGVEASAIPSSGPLNLNSGLHSSLSGCVSANLVPVASHHVCGSEDIKKLEDCNSSGNGNKEGREGLWLAAGASGSTADSMKHYFDINMLPSEKSYKEYPLCPMGSVFHLGVCCDGCGIHPITGSRFTSKVNNNYDLCSVCFSKMGNQADYIRMDYSTFIQHPYSFWQNTNQDLNPQVPLPALHHSSPFGNEMNPTPFQHGGSHTTSTPSGSGMDPSPLLHFGGFGGFGMNARPLLKPSHTSSSGGGMNPSPLVVKPSHTPSSGNPSPLLVKPSHTSSSGNPSPLLMKPSHTPSSGNPSPLLVKPSHTSSTASGSGMDPSPFQHFSSGGGIKPSHISSTPSSSGMDPSPLLVKASHTSSSGSGMNPSRLLFSSGGVIKPSRPMLDSCFIMDVNVLDGTIMAPSTPFTKIWRMMNNGPMVWPQGTQLVWTGGHKLSDAVSVELQISSDGLPVHNEIDVAVEFTAPDPPGQYISYWMMASPSGEKFGQRVWVFIQVEASSKDLNNSCCGLNLNLPPNSNFEPIVVDDRLPELDNYIRAVDLVQPIVDARPNKDQEMSFPVNETSLVGVGHSNPAFPEARTKVTYPNIDMSEVALCLPSHMPSPSNNIPASAGQSNNDIEQSLLRELEEMGFKQVDLNREILRRNEYDLEQSVDDLCDVAEWDPILEELLEMGFCDEKMNRRLLKKNNGNIKRVVMDLISGEKV